MCYNVGDYARATTLIEKATRLLEHFLDSPAYFSAQVLLSYIHFREAKPEAALAQLNKADQFKGQRSRQDEIGFFNHRAFAREMLGDMDGAVTDLQRAIAIATDSRDALYQVRLLGNLALILCSFGERDRSEASIREALRVAEERCVHGFFFACCLLQYANISLCFGALKRARDLIERVLATSVGAIEVQIDAASYGISVALQLGDQGLLERCVRADLLEDAFVHNVRRQIASIAKGFVEFFVAQGRMNEAQALLHRVVVALSSLPDEAEEEILPYVAAHGLEGDIGPARELMLRHAALVKSMDAQGQLALFEAYALLRAGEVEQSQTFGAKAAEIYRRLQRPNHEAAALELAGEIEAALRLYREIGNVRDARRLEHILAPPNRRGRTKHELTQRESHVAKLIGEGKSNRAIAGELVISERTVETHVASIYHKLNVSSRSELIARLARAATIDH